jgi:vesicle-associated membrane protein 7
MGEKLDTEVAFSYLGDLKKKFLAKYDNNTIKHSFSYQLKDFSDEIKQLANSYEINPTSKIGKLKEKLSEATEILHDNVEKLLQRGEKLNIIAQKSNRLRDSSDDFVKNIQEIKRRQKWRKYRCYAIIIIFFLFLFLTVKYIF